MHAQIEKRRYYLIEALRARREEVRSKLSAIQTQPREVVSVKGYEEVHKADPIARDAEECLRTLMVKILPAVRSSNASESDLARSWVLLEAIESKAASGELRFLDGWNVFYECCVCRLSSSASRKFEFLRHYCEILNSVIASLDEAS